MYSRYLKTHPGSGSGPEVLYVQQVLEDTSRHTGRT